MTREEWRDIPGHPGYRVSSFGRILNPVSNRIHFGSLASNGYLVATVKGKTRTIHSMVAEAFLGGCKPCVDHINRCKTDNGALNLRIISVSANAKHAANGGGHNFAKITKRKAERIRELYRTGKYSQTELGKMFGIRQTQVSNIVNYKSW